MECVSWSGWVGFINSIMSPTVSALLKLFELILSVQPTILQLGPSFELQVGQGEISCSWCGTYTAILYQTFNESELERTSFYVTIMIEFEKFVKYRRVIRCVNQLKYCFYNQ